MPINIDKSIYRKQLYRDLLVFRPINID